MNQRRAIQLLEIALYTLTLAIFGCYDGPTAPPAFRAAPTPAPTATGDSTLNGIVVDGFGRGLGNALIRILDGPNAGRTATSDAGTGFTIGGLSAGTITVRASKSAYTSQTKVVTLPKNASVAVDFRLVDNE